MFGGAKKWSERNVAQKACKKCNTVFQPKCGGSKYCLTCSAEVKRANHAKGQRDWRAKNPDRHAKAKTAWDLSKYGIDIATYERMLLEQNGGCAICGNTSPVGRGKHRKFAVDHCHTTGAVRGLLCSACNTGLGLFSDDITKLESAIAYLRRRQ